MVSNQIPLQVWISKNEHELEKPVPSDTKTLIPAKMKRHKLRRLQEIAANNACTFIFLAILNIPTWIMLILLSWDR